jgi:hypothetical protein
VIYLTINQIQKFVMRNVFTKFFMVSLMTVMTISLSFGQELNTMTVNSPSGLAGDYRVARALFGSQSNNPITADAIFGAPAIGCNPLTTNGSGKIVFLNRGTCAFDVKCLNAQNSGAVAVVICAILPNETIQMMPAGSVGAQVTIPAFYASQETCNRLRVDLTGGGVNITLRNKVCSAPTYSANAVWGHLPGQGDFSNGLDNWTTNQGWVANAEGVIRNGAYTGGPKVVGSETYCNGVAEFNSDFLDNAGMTNSDGSPVAGAGTCPSPCTGFLLSPNIVFDQPLANGLIIEFSQSLRQFTSEYYIMVSKDGGNTFADTLQINTEYPVNSNHNSERRFFSFDGYQGATSIRFKFEKLGDYYYWAIDDVVVYDASLLDLQVNRNWYSVSPHYKMPKSQVSEIPFMTDISNSGNAAGEDVLLTATVTGPSTNQKFELFYGEVEGGSILENRPFPVAFTSPANVGTYTAEYSLEANGEDVNPANNTAGFQWKVTENTFGNLDTEVDFGSNYMVFYASGWVGIPNNKVYSVGNSYYVPKGNGYQATKVRYGLNNALSTVDEQFIRIDLFEWNDVDNSGTCTPNERTRVGAGYQFISSEIPNLRNIESDIWVADETGEPIEDVRVDLKDDTHYLIAVSVIPSSPELDPTMELLGFTPRDLDNYNRSIGHMLATNFALDSLENLGILEPRVTGSLQAWENVVAPTIEDIDMRNFRFIFNGTAYTKSYVEMDIALKSSSTETVLPKVAVKTFPNPAARDLFVDLALEKVSENVEVSMFDIEGRLVSTRTFNNIKEDRLRLDISTLTNGVYNVRIVTSEGIASRKVVVQN